MIETIQVNISQRLFTLEKEAYEKLHQYLESIKYAMNASPQEIEEILADIEQRIADLLELKLDSGKLILSKTDIQEVIEVIGNAEVFADSNSSAEPTNMHSQNAGYENHAEQPSKARQLYRDIENRILGGVCSGLGWYFRVDPLWIRLALVALFFLKGFGLLAYLILWLVVPAARNKEQILYMKGKDYDSTSNPLRPEQNSRNLLQNILQSFGEIILIFLKVFAILILICLGMAFLVFALGLTTVLSIVWPFTWHFNTPQLFNPILDLFQIHPFFLFAFLLIIILPLIAILSGIVRLIFNIPRRNYTIAAFLWTIWVLALVLIIYILVSREPNRQIHPKFNSGIRNEYPIQLLENQTLYIKTTSTETGEGRLKHFSIFSKEVIHNTSDNQYFLHPTFRIAPTEANEITIVEERYTIFPGFDNHFASHEIIYSYSQTDTILSLPDYFSIGNTNIWNIPRVRITLLVPEGRRIIFDEKIHEIIETDIWKLKSDTETPIRQPLIMKKGKLERF